jgi:hypothetical protein
VRLPLLLAGLSCAVIATTASAQEKTFRQSTLPALETSAVRLQPVPNDPDVEARIAAKHFADEALRRLQPIQQRLRQDTMMRSAGAVLGAGVIALTTVRDSRSLAAVGTQVLRFGLDTPLTQLRNRSGFMVEPAIGHRTFSIRLSRRFEP